MKSLSLVPATTILPSDPNAIALAASVVEVPMSVVTLPPVPKLASKDPAL